MILVDSSVLIGFLLRRDRRHKDAVRLLGPVFKGIHGSPAITDYIVDEVLTFLVSRGATRSHLDKAIAFLLGDGKLPGAFILHRVGADDFAQALSLVRRHRDRTLSFTDCTSLAVMSSIGIQAIASFDAGFDGLVQRMSDALGD